MEPCWFTAKWRATRATTRGEAPGPQADRREQGRAGRNRFVADGRFVAKLAQARGLLSLLVMVPVAILVAFSPLRFPAQSYGHLACQSVGWLLFLAGAILRWWATLYVGGKKSIALITDGAYSVTRNPLYLGTYLLALSAGVLAQSATFCAGAVVVGVFYLITVSVEERKLHLLYGDSFEAYCQRVPRFLPNFRLLQCPEILSVWHRGMRSELIRMCRWVSIPFICELFNHLRAEAWWPIWFELP